jgi:hypothetical protein
MTASELIKLIPASVFQDLALETKVDQQVKKLSGEVIFKLILFSMLNSEKVSLRVLETFINSAQFKAFSHYDIIDGKFNSIHDRICAIKADYFERLFQTIFSIYNKELKEQSALSRADSTYIGLAAKLLENGMCAGAGAKGQGTNKRFVKYSINLKGSLPSVAKAFTGQSYVSEDKALAELIESTGSGQGNIVVFDRGLQCRASFDSFTGSGKLFVCRAKVSIACKDFVARPLPVAPPDAPIEITSDGTALIMAEKAKKTAYRYRIIRGISKSSGKELCFITNIEDGSPYQITECYRQRWDIEVFFKFIKQHLNAKHLVSRNENGIKVMLYMTMIVAILIIVYKKLNRISGMKIAKLRFELELENSLVKEIVILCGGNPENAPHLFNSS